jgi:hypothetical protein
MRRIAVAGILVAFAALLLAQGGSSGVRPAAATVTAPETFVSLVPACACGRPTVIATFSLRNGRRLRTIRRVTPPPGGGLTLSGSRSGEVVLTGSRPARCSNGTAGCGPVPDTCRARVSRLDGRQLVSLFSVSSSTFVLDAAASPSGRRIAMLAGPCTSGVTHILIRDPGSGRQLSIGSDLPRCTSLGAPAWSGKGRRLVFPYGPVAHPRHLPPIGICPITRYARLAIASALRPSESHAWKLIKADPGCSYEAAAFGFRGIVAVEGCRGAGSPGSSIDPALGRARLVQLSASGRVLARFALKPGWEDGAVTADRRGRILISQDQPANQSYPERDWVWTFDGRRLHLVGHYRANDAAQVIGVLGRG